MDTLPARLAATLLTVSLALSILSLTQSLALLNASLAWSNRPLEKISLYSLAVEILDGAPLG